ncbi:hypothetical protein DVH05_004934 [Phytophthora capsici]|nr:hypothetical protein DVH05_004934 [Phytophthora capsici]
MRLTYLLLVIATTLFSCNNATASGSSSAKLVISDSADPLHNGDAAEIVGKRILRGSNAEKNKYFDEEEVEEEERALPNLSKLDDEANLKILVDIFKYFDDAGVPGLKVFIKKEAMDLDDLASMMTLYQRYRGAGADDFMDLMKKKIGVAS